MPINYSAQGAAAALSGGSLVVYGGAQPPNADTPAVQSPLVTFTFNAPAFQTGAVGAVVANTMPNGVATASGAATWYRCYDSVGVPVLDGSLGGDDDALSLSELSINAGDPVSVSSLAIPLGG